MPPLTMQERRSYQGDILSLQLPYVRCLLSRSRGAWVLRRAVSRPPGRDAGEKVSPHVSMGRATCPRPLPGSSRGCPTVWSISHHMGCCSCESTVRSPDPFGLSCGNLLLGRRPPPALCTGSPFTSCFHGSG